MNGWTAGKIVWLLRTGQKHINNNESVHMWNCHGTEYQVFVQFFGEMFEMERKSICIENNCERPEETHRLKDIILR